MGGKRKQAQRTKNNVRPSSSGRSAELLGANVSSFVGFSTIKEGGYVPVLPSFSEDQDSSISTDFQLVLKKMNKKDSVTKLKALNEFGALCRESEPPAVKAILSFWPRLYCVLATDAEHRVREAAHNAHRAVVSSVGRSIAPYLKQLVGAWFTSQYDTYPPAASAATLSFKEAFPPNKMIEAIIFCQEEILNYIYDNLINHTAQSLSNPKHSTQDEMDAKYQRVIVSSLHGYALYLTRLPEEQIHKAEELNRKLVGSTKFWKYAKHDAPIVRTAWFTALVSLCQSAPFLLTSEKKHVTLSVFNNLDESDPTVLPIVWEASLHTIVTIEDWPEYVSAEKLVFPKLWRILREGGLGSAATIYPNILPLLSKIPASLIPDKGIFYSKFFLSLFEGTKQRSIHQSPGESDAVAECFMECLSYTVLKNIDDTPFCNNLVSNQLMTMIEATLRDGKLKLLGRALYNKLSSTLIQWSRQVSKNYENLLEVVWKKLIPLCQDVIASSLLDRNLLVVGLNAQAEMFSALKNYKIKQRKHLKVTFSEDNEDSCSPPVENQVPSEKEVEASLEQLPQNFKTGLDRFVQEMVKMCFHHISANTSHRPLFVEHLSKIVTIYDSSCLFAIVTSLTGEGRTWKEFYDEHVLGWLGDNEVSVEAVLNLTFTLLKYVQNEGEKDCVLDSLSNTDSKCVLEWCLKKDNIRYSSVKEWLQHDKINSILETLLDSALSDNTANTREFDILKKCLSRTEQSVFVINYKTVILILNRLKSALENFDGTKDSATVDSTIELLETGVEALIECGKATRYSDEIAGIVVACFRFCLVQNLSESLDAAWLKMVATLAESVMHESEILSALPKKCSSVITQFIFTRNNLTYSEIQRTVGQVAKYLQALEKSGYDKVDETIDIFMSSVFSQTRCIWDGSILQLCYRAEIVDGALGIAAAALESNEKDHIDSLSSDVGVKELAKCVTSSLFPVLLLYEILGIEAKEDNDYTLSNIDLNQYSEYLADLVLKVTAFRIFRRHFSKTKQIYEVVEKISILDTRVKELVQRLHNDGAKEVEKEILLRGDSSSCAGLWAEALYLLHTDFRETEGLNDVLHSILEENKLSSQFCSVWLPQVFAIGTVRSEGFESRISELELTLLCSHLRSSKSKEKSVEFQTLCVSWLEKIVKLGKMQTFETELSACSDNDVERSSDVADFLSLMVLYCPEEFIHTGWDCPMIATASWILSLKKTVASGDSVYSSLRVLRFACSVCRLFRAMSSHMSLPDNKESAVSAEWRDVFLTDMQKSLTEMWLSIAEHYQDKQSIEPELVLILLNELSEIIREYVDINAFVDKDSSVTWLDACCKHMQSHVAEIQLTAFNLFVKLVPRLVTSDATTEEDSTVELSCRHLQDALKHTQAIVDTTFSELRLGDTCIVEPFTDSYTYTRSYLFLWLAILELCDRADSQLRFMYTGWIKENQFLRYLMKSLFCLMPEEAVHIKEGNIKYIQEMFSNSPDFSTVLWDSKTLAHLSCWTYYKLLGRLPAEVRQWWGEIDHKLVTLVERLTSTFVSPLLCAHEMKAIQQEGKAFQNMTIYVRPGAREVVAVYTVEESSTELIIQLPINHPLGPPKVESGKFMVSSSHTRQWVMKLSLFLTHQNGTICDGLTLWKNALDKKFEGVEECYICFAVLHNVSQQLPKLTCQTCKKKFHSACLYKWFTTSNKSTCPICRNLF